MRGSRDPSGQSLERARENGMEKDAERTDGEGGRYLWSSRKSGGAQPSAPSPIGRPLNLGGQTALFRYFLGHNPIIWKIAWYISYEWHVLLTRMVKQLEIPPPIHYKPSY